MYDVRVDVRGGGLHMHCSPMLTLLQEIITDNSHPKYVCRVYCGHLYHQNCLDTYMKTPPFAGECGCDEVGSASTFGLLLFVRDSNGIHDCYVRPLASTGKLQLYWSPFQLMCVEHWYSKFFSNTFKQSQRRRPGKGVWVEVCEEGLGRGSRKGTYLHALPIASTYSV